MIITRIVLNIILFVALFISPWWAVGFMLCICLVAFPYYVEAMMFAFLLDVINGAYLQTYPIPWMTLVAVAVFLITFLLQGRFRTFSYDI